MDNKKQIFFILNNLWLIITNITKLTKGLEVPELREEDMPVIQTYFYLFLYNNPIPEQTSAAQDANNK